MKSELDDCLVRCEVNESTLLDITNKVNNLMNKPALKVEVPRHESPRFQSIHHWSAEAEEANLKVMLTRQTAALQVLSLQEHQTLFQAKHTCALTLRT